MHEAVKLCECGCGSPTSIASRNRYDRGQFKGQPLRFISGHNYNEPPPSGPGPLNPSWKGDDCGYFGIHLWLNRHYPKAGACAECGVAGPTHWAFQRSPAPYTRDIADYREMCGSCHRRLDYRASDYPKAPCPECGRMCTPGPLVLHRRTHQKP